MSQPPLRLGRVLVFVVSVTVGLMPAALPAHAQHVPAEVQQQAEAAFYGDDPDSKDGPLAKVGQDLAELYHSYERHQKQAPAEPYRPQRGLFTVRDDAVVVDATAQESADALRADLEDLGLRRSAQAGRVVSGLLPIAAIPDAAELEQLRALRPSVAVPQRSSRASGTVTSEGVQAMRADDARADSDVDGDGVTVGVLSDTYDADPGAATSASEDIASGDLPPEARIDILADLDEGTDEGRAMMQIIHDVAPGADLAFHTAIIGQAGFVEGIEALVDEGAADVLVDDILFLGEPMFQDGVIAQAADASVQDGGAAYFSSAGNTGVDSYEGAFEPSGEAGILSPRRAELHDFGGGETFQDIIIPEGDSLRLTFQWTDAYASAGGAGADSELDIFLLDDNDEVVAQSNFPNRNRDPIEFLEFTNDGSFESDRFRLGIELFAGPPPERIKYVAFPSVGVGIDDIDDAGATPTLYGHANARHAAAVGAAFWANTPPWNPDVNAPLVNSFSAVGGVPLHFDADGIPRSTPEVRDKPNITGPDGVATTFFGEDATNDDRRNFFGTSAAAPHAAAVAALMLDFDDRRAPAQIYRDLQQTAEDITEAWDLSAGEFIGRPVGEGFDRTSGHGFVRADRAVPQATEVFAFDARLEGSEEVAIDWSVDEEAEIESFTLKQQTFTGAFEPIATRDAEAGPDFSVTTDPLPIGRYTYRLQWTYADESTGSHPDEPSVDVDVLTLDADVNDDDVALSWTVPPATEDVTYDVQKRSGEEGFQTVGTTTDQTLTVEDLQPGTYDFRLRMEDAGGNVLASQRTATETVDQTDFLDVSEAYPNPFGDRVQFDVTAEGGTVLNVRVYNALGEIVKFRGVRLEARAPRTITVEPQSNWSSGVYYVQFFDRDRREVTSRQAVFVR